MTIVPAPGVKLGRYRLISRVGIGGMGEVFVAEEGPRRVAIKTMLPHLSSQPAIRAMFEREANLAMRVVHENVVQVFDLGVVDEVYFIAMELVEGPTVRTWAERRPRVPLEEAAGVAIDVARGLSAIHGMARNLVHRDVTPDNMLIDARGLTKLSDFGIAVAADMTRHTKTGELKGKVPFLAPEQLIGESVDARADLFQLGVVLYWLLTGKRPFDRGTELATLNAIVQEPAPPPSSLRADVPPALDALILRMLEKEPVARPASAADVAAALGAVVPLHRRPLLEALERPTAENPIPRLVTLGTGGGAASVLTSSDDDAPPETSRTLQLASEPTVVVARDGPTDPSTDPSLEREPATTPPAGSRDTVRVDMAAFTQPNATNPLQPAPDLRPTRPTPALEPRRSPLGAVAVAVAVVAVVGAVAGVVINGADGGTESAALVDAGARAGSVGDAGAVVAVAEPVVPEIVVEEPVESEREKPVPAAPAGGASGGPRNKLVVDAPPSVSVVSESGRKLGRGSGTVRTDERNVVLVDDVTGGRVSVAARGSVKWDELPRGKLDVRVYPEGDLFVGKKAYGTIPVVPLPELVAGKYRVRVRSGGRDEVRNVVVAPNKTTVVKIQLAP